jgi:hypothetical protein
MKKFTFLGKLTIGLIVLALFHSCQSPVIQEDELDAGLSLKSASGTKHSYIVQLNDPELVEARPSGY